MNDSATPVPDYCRPTVTGQPGRYTLVIDPRAGVGPPGHQFMMGGIGVGALVAALEAETGKPLVNANAQFLAPAHPGETLSIDVELLQVGRRMTQARAIGRADDRAVLAVTAALGTREAQPDAQFVAAPTCPPTAECPEIPRPFPELADLHSHLRMWDAGGDEDAGRALHWLGPIPGGMPSAPLLAVIADFLAGGIERTRGASSLDNVLRIAALVPTDHVLCEITIEAITRGSFHGTSRLFAEDGTLLATASQSGAVPKLGAGWAHAHVSDDAKQRRGR